MTFTGAAVIRSLRGVKRGALRSLSLYSCCYFVFWGNYEAKTRPEKRGERRDEKRGKKRVMPSPVLSYPSLLFSLCYLCLHLSLNETREDMKKERREKMKGESHTSPSNLLSFPLLTASTSFMRRDEKRGR